MPLRGDLQRCANWLAGLKTPFVQLTGAGLSVPGAGLSADPPPPPPPQALNINNKTKSESTLVCFINMMSISKLIHSLF
jgi:hypothetical protein